jgi:hypothetical protein
LLHQTTAQVCLADPSSLRRAAPSLLTILTVASQYTRNTKSDILKKPGKNGEGRVMRQEDLEAIRAGCAERAKQDAAKKAAGKAKRGRPKATAQTEKGEPGKKRGRKRKFVGAEEGDLDEQEEDVSGPSAKAARVNDALIDPMLEMWRAPVAQMW